MKHTKGPWKVSVADYVVKSEKHLHATYHVNGGKLMGIDEAQANARLISGAPEMYELLTAFEEEDVQWDSEFVSNFAYEASKILKRVRGEK